MNHQILNFIACILPITFITAQDLVVTAKGTGQTTGHIATLTIINRSELPYFTLPVDFYIPSDGRHQSYVGSVPEDIELPPGQKIIVPVRGYCADVYKPPVPMNEDLPSIDEWLIADPPAAPEPMNPPKRRTVNILEGIIVTPFDESRVDFVKTHAQFTSEEEDNPELDITYPGTNIRINPPFSPDTEPEVMGPLLIETIRRIEAVVDEVLSDPSITTPFVGNAEKERETVIQQTFWIYTATLTGKPYVKSDFEEKVHAQFENNTGMGVADLDEEKQDELKQGVDDFWNSFMATGASAKIIDADRSGEGIGSDILIDFRTPKCECDSIGCTITIKEGRTEVYSESHTLKRSITTINAALPDFKYGKEYSVEITSISVSCACSDASCLYFPAESDDPDSDKSTRVDETRPGKVNIHIENDGASTKSTYGNHNCSNSNKGWNDSETEYSFKLKTVDEGSNDDSVFQRILIKAYCTLPDCNKGLCKKRIQLNLTKKP